MTQQEIFYWAIQNNCTKILKYLLKEKFRVDPAVYNNFAIRWAAREGHLEVVKELLAAKDDKGRFRVDPAADDNYAIKRAARNGNKEIVKLLSEEIKKRGL